jgi:hypothetical protein
MPMFILEKGDGTANNWNEVRYDLDKPEIRLHLQLTVVHRCSVESFRCGMNGGTPMRARLWNAKGGMLHPD